MTTPWGFWNAKIEIEKEILSGKNYVGQDIHFLLCKNFWETIIGGGSSGSFVFPEDTSILTTLGSKIKWCLENRIILLYATRRRCFILSSHVQQRLLLFFFLQIQSESHSKFVLCIIIICMQLSMHKSHFHFRAFEETHFLFYAAAVCAWKLCGERRKKKTIKILVDGLNAW